ncbi:hypothetical protein Pla110_31140 [Polystyrenella longa]|uniref:Uncharacterized protein n=1 Tax=Polystyrenella longa TaxID=2528007 RepID=A0A518CQ87_9PLAN|nr:hypothetical protein [Polystyrenella longa]QDU81373.1 hypothetical protein Pla110_31140 [Polystyrenella longa]
MPVTFNQCPSCKSMLLPDTPVCPTCKHVMQNEGNANEVGQNTLEGVSVEDQDQEVECPGCGEMVRSGLVRCWNCSGFMREDIAAAYREMKSRPQQVIYSPESLQEAQADQEAFEFEEDDEEGFELSTGVSSSGSFSLKNAPAAADSATSISANSVQRFTPEQDQKHEQTESEDAPIAEDIESQPESVDASEETVYPLAEATSDDAAKSTDESAPTETPVSNRGDAFKRDENEVSHSEATGADVLLNIALEEERESGKKRNKLAPGMFIVYCPKGHRIKVREKHRGLTGRCPVCKATFHVPKEEPKPKPTEEVDNEGKLDEGSTDEQTIVTGDYSGWMQDVCQHQVDPSRLKLRPGSLTKEFVPAEIAFSKEGVLICELTKSGSLFGSGAKKNPAIREEIYEHLRQGISIEKLPCHKHRFFSTENFSELRIVQPCPPGQTSLFHDIPVFGEARIAVQMPRMDESSELEFLSFSLSQFRQFANGMRSVCGLVEFAADAGIPMEATYEVFKCHYTSKTVPALDQPEYYKADSSFELISVGYQCEKCGLVMSEEGRTAEKFGGAKAKSIAKAKCPGCEGKFGSLVLEALKDDPILSLEPEAEEQTEDETAESTETDNVEISAVTEETPAEEANADSDKKSE